MAVVGGGEWLSPGGLGGGVLFGGGWEWVRRLSYSVFLPSASRRRPPPFAPLPLSEG